MKCLRNILVITIFLSTVIAACSCNGGGNPDTGEMGNQTNEKIKQGEDDISMLLATKEEFLQYINDNDTGLTENDLEGIDIEDLIKEYSLTVDYIGRYNWEKTLESYKLRKILERKATIMAKEIRSVDSTEEEYRLFVEAYFKAVDEEYYFLGTNNRFLLDTYTIIAENTKYRISIGKTKNMEKYDIRDSGSYGTCEIYLPEGDMAMRTQYCYSADNKFFILADNNDDFSQELFEIFAQMNVPQ